MPVSEGLVSENAFRPQVAVSNNGSYVVTWYDYSPQDESPAQGGARRAWKARFFDSDGQASSPPIDIYASDRDIPMDVPSQTAMDKKGKSRVVLDDNGRASCFWLEHSPKDGATTAPYEFRLYASRFDSQGIMQDLHHHILTFATPVGEPSLADFDVGVTSDGGYILAWSSSESGLGPSHVMAQHFANDFTPVGEAIKLNTRSWSPVETHSMVDLAMDQDDSYVVGWLERSYLDLPERTKETYVTINKVEVSAQGRIQSYGRQLSRPVALSDEYLPPVFERVSGNGYFIMLPFWQMSDDDRGGSTVLASRYISLNGFQRVNWNSLPGSPVDGLVNVSATLTPDRRLIVAFEDALSGHATLRVGVLDQELMLENDAWLGLASSTADSMRHPQIAARDDGKLVVVFEQATVERGNTMIQRSVYAGIFDLNSSPVTPVKPNPHALEILRQGEGKVMVSWKTELGRSYQLLMGSNIDSLEISENVIGTGAVMRREWAIDERDAFFIAVSSEE